MPLSHTGRLLLGPIAVALIAAVVLFAAPTDGGSASAPTFNPGSVTCFENFETPAECDGDSAPGANADLRVKFCLGWGADCGSSPLGHVSTVGDSIYSFAVFFTPPAWSLRNDVPIGALSGQLTAMQTLGALSNPCFNSTSAIYSLLTASVNTADTVSPRPPGQPNALEPLAADQTPGNGIPDGADKYPAFLQQIFTGDAPYTRLFGASKIFGGWLTVNLLFFSPGASIAVGGSPIAFNAALGYPTIAIVGNPLSGSGPSPLSDFCAPENDAVLALGKTMNNPCTPLPSPAGANCPGGAVFQSDGYPMTPCEAHNRVDDDGDTKINDGCPKVGVTAESGAQCDNSTGEDDGGEDSTVNDGCPQVGDQSEAARIPGACSGTDEGGCTFLQNPATAGAHTFTLWTESFLDADSDGTENLLDVCVVQANPSWNPRGEDADDDPDNDGLPKPCDPDDAVPSALSQLLTCPFTGIVGPDEDGDCYSNRQDNCPLVNQISGGLPLNGDTDRDGIGDACDPAPFAPTGEKVSLCLKATLQVGSPPGPAVATVDPTPGPVCATGGPTPTPGGPPVWGDIDCSGAVNSVDAVKIQRFAAGLTYEKPPLCPALGAPYP